jgi:two-component system, OmpR family, response regulator
LGRTAKRHVVVVDDDADVRLALADALRDNGYLATTVAGGVAMWPVLNEQHCDLLIIDLYLDGENGLHLARRVRAASAIPIIMLTGKGDETDRILGLEVAADDFLMKPFNLRELLARVHANIRRTTQLSRTFSEPIASTHECLLFGEWVLDLTSRELRDSGGERVDLTYSEYALLEILVKSPGRVFSRGQLLDLLHSSACDVYDRSIDVMILRLRRKIEPTPKQPRHILTKRGAGYFLAAKVRVG